MNAPAPLSARPEKLRLRADDFLLLNDSGAFAEYSKAELIDGDIFCMNAQYADHARIKSRLHVQLANRLTEMGSDLEALVEVTVRVAEDGAPEPDIVLTRWRAGGIVPADSVALVVEVADTTLATDAGRKADLYAAAGIPEYWIVDLADKRILVNHDPVGSTYRKRADIPMGLSVAAATIDGLIVETEHLSY